MKPNEPMNQEKNNPEETSLLKRALLAIQDTRAKLEAAERRNSEPIAIIGMGCRFPGGARNAESFWQLLRDGRDAIVPVPSERWDADAYYDANPDAPGKMVTCRGGFLSAADAPDMFDAAFFEIAPREAASMDPQQRLALTVAWETLENAGYAPASLRGSRTGVFLGIASNDYSQRMMAADDTALLDAHFASGVAHSVASGRIAYLLGLEGPGVSLDTACSSSLVAIHLACQSLRAGDCTLALAGGVNLMLAPETTALLSRARMLSPAGTCRAFDDSADGFVRGEGCGMVALKTLARAQADGDNVLAVIRGTAINQDGASSSLTAPNGPSQVRLMRQALENACLEPHQVSYVEAHGTGTALGDPIELQALGAVYGADSARRAGGSPLLVGSLKTNIGHAEAAAGVAGLIKTVLSLQHRQIPPHLHCNRPTTHVRWDQLHLQVPHDLTPWNPDGLRIAGISSFGFSGTNAHVIVAEAEPAHPPATPNPWPVQLLAASAKTENALAQVVEQYRTYLEQNPQADLRDVCFTANTGRTHFRYRASFLAPDRDSMLRQLSGFSASAPSAVGVAGDTEPRVCFLFTGQGSLYAGMGRDLYESNAVFRSAVQRCDELWKQETGESFLERLYPADANPSSANASYPARHAQPMLFAVEYGLAELWLSWGIQPTVALGHSLGEYVAAVVAGVFSLQDGLRLVNARSRLMDSLTSRGAMCVVNASEPAVAAALKDHRNAVDIAAVNGPQSVVISGMADAVTHAAAALEAEGMRTKMLDVTHGFHSAQMDPLLEEFERIAGQVEYHPPRIRMALNLTGTLANGEEMGAASYWRQHLRHAVRFHDCLLAALEYGCDTFLELGPQPHLLALGKSISPQPGLRWLPSMRRGRNAWLDLSSAVQALYEGGAEIDWNALHGGAGRRIPLPTYPFARQRHWFPQRTVQPSPSSVRHIDGHPLLGERLDSPLAEIQFQSVIGPGQPSYLGDHSIAGQRVLPAAAYLEIALSAMRALGEHPADLVSSVFFQPCIFDEPRRLQTVLRREGAVRSFAIYSAPVASRNDGQPWILHATGEFAAAPQPIEPASPGSLQQLRQQCGKPADAAAMYRAFESAGANFGPAFCAVQQIFIGDNQALVRIQLAPGLDAGSNPYEIHPAALDACFQSMIAALLAQGTEEGLYLPAALDRLGLQPGWQNLAWAHAQLRPGQTGNPAQGVIADITGFRADGTILLVASGLLLRPVSSLPQQHPASDATADLLYSVEWIPLAPDSNAPSAPMPPVAGTVVVCGEPEDAAAMAAALQSRSIPALTIDPTRIEKNSAAAWQHALEEAAGQSPLPISSVIYLSPCESDDAVKLDADRLMEQQARVLQPCLDLGQALLRMEWKETPGFFLVTRGARGPAASSISCASLAGFGRSLALEHPELHVTQLDFDPAALPQPQDLLRCFELSSKESEMALRGNVLYVPRLRKHSPPPASLHNGEPDRNLRLQILQPGTIEGLAMVESARKDPGSGEVEIQIAAAGLNFRDVLSVLGMYPGSVGPLGGECAGTVVRVGAGVSSLQPGDEVVALGQGCFSRFVTVRAAQAWKKPAQLSFAAAATVPIAFLTAWYALRTLADVQPGERVLIHAGAGGVGLAAIQVARNAGAEVFATAGSERKRVYLRSIGVQHVMDSRSLAFVDQVHALPGGRGVDVVLNSLTGAFVDAGLQALAPGGRFVELGVADLRDPATIAVTHPNIVYQSFNLAPALEAGDSLITEILSEVLAQIESGQLHALPREIFSLDDAAAAFRYMAQARHIGRVILSPAAPRPTPVIRRDGAYLVTGGLSGIGFEVLQWLSQAGAAQVIALGRSMPDPATSHAIDKLRQTGTAVSVARGDVTNPSDVQAAIDLAEVPLRGVFHCAGVLEDGSLLRQSWPRFEQVLSPKLEGAIHLHQRTLDRPLDHFVLFSSVASVFGSPGQTNYAAANASLDALAHHRHRHGLPALSINWGAWSETGLAARQGLAQQAADAGLSGLSNAEGLRALEALLADASAQAMVARVDWRLFAERNPGRNGSLLQGLQRAESLSASAPSIQPSHPQPAVETWLPRLQSMAPTRRSHCLLQLLEQRVQAVLGLDSQPLDPHQPLQELGLDSLLSIELRNSLSACLGVSLPATLLFNYPTLSALADYIAREFLSGAADAAPTTSRPPQARPANLLEEIELLSDEEVDRLLSAKTAGGVQ